MIEVVVARYVETGIQAQVVDGRSGMEPLLVGEHPGGLHTGEDAPAGTEGLQAAVGLDAEVRRGLGREVQLQVVALQVVVLRLCIPGNAGPAGAAAIGTGVGAALREGRLVVAGVVAELGVERIALPVDAGTTEGADLVGIVAVLPRQAGVAHERVLLREERTHLVLAGRGEALNVVVGHAVDGNVVLLVGAHQVVAEVLLQAEAGAEVEAGRHGNVEHGVLETVLVLGIAIGIEGVGVAQPVVVGLVVVQGLIEIALVVHVEVVAQTATGVGVGAEEGALGIGQERGRRDGAVAIGGGRAVVAQVAAQVRERGVEAGVELLREVDVGVEANVQPVHRVVVERALGVGIAQRQVVVGHVVATLHVDAVVLGEGRAVDLLLPVGLVVVLAVVIVVGILVQELEVAHRGVGGLQHFRGIAAILLGAHHIDELGLERHAGRDAGGDAGGHGLVAARVDEDDAVGALGTIEGRAVAQHGDALDVGRRDVGQHVVVEAAVQHLAVALLVEDHAVDHDEGLGIAVERVQTVDEHHAAYAGRAATADGVDLGAQLLLDFLLDGTRRRNAGHDGGDTRRRCAGHGGLARRRHGGEGLQGGGVEAHVGQGGLMANALERGVEVGGAEAQGRAEVGHDDLVAAFLVGERAVALDLVAAHEGAYQRLASRGIEHAATQRNRLGLGHADAAGNAEDAEDVSDIVFHLLHFFQCSTFYSSSCGFRMMQSSRRVRV